MDRRMGKLALLVPIMVVIVVGVSCFYANPSANIFPESATLTSPSPDFSITASPNNIIQNGANFKFTNPSQFSQRIHRNGGSLRYYQFHQFFVFPLSKEHQRRLGQFVFELQQFSFRHISRNGNRNKWNTFPLHHGDRILSSPNVGFVTWATPANINDTVDASRYVTRLSDVAVVPLVTFQSGVSLTLSTNSTNFACYLTPNTYFPAGTGGDTGLWCTADAAGNYLANVTAQGGTISHSVTVTYHIQDFILATGPQSLTIDTGSTGTTTITFSPLNGFNMNVTLSLSNYSPTLFCSLSQTSIVGGSGTATLSCNGTTPGNYVVSVTTTAGHRTQTLAFSY